MKEHSVETNELFNLMARHIKKRGEERINLYLVNDSGKQSPSKRHNHLGFEKEVVDEIDAFLIERSSDEELVAFG